MKDLLKLNVTILACLFLAASLNGQHVTSAEILGTVCYDHEPLSKASVIIRHAPTGDEQRVLTDDEGHFRLLNLKIGGPYSLSVELSGFRPVKKAEIFLNLGQALVFEIDLEPEIIAHESSVVTEKYGETDEIKMGTETVLSNNRISALPSLLRNLTDHIRIMPQANTGNNDLVSVAGMNSRYNSFSIDGAINNDIFALSGSTTIGSQTGGTPISLDAIEQFHIAVSPFDVRQSGFTGASINAITRSGSNIFDCSIYTFYRNQYLAGKTPGALTLPEGMGRERLPSFQAGIYGARLGGPLVKNRLFFFINAEVQRDAAPQAYNFSSYQGLSSEAQISAFSNRLKTEYNYEPGNFIDSTKKLDGEKLFGRLDWEINGAHKLTLRHSYTRNEATIPYPSNNWSINFENHGVFYPSATNSTALELRSIFGRISNDLIVSYTRVREDKDPMGADFPAIRITDGYASINAGSDAYSSADTLSQDIFSITNNTSIFKGRHLFTLGINGEFYSVNYLSLFYNFGEYTWLSLDQFMDNLPPSRYVRKYSLIDMNAGDYSRAASAFSFLQFGLYAQDEYLVNDRLRIKYGIRFDMPVFTKRPTADVDFNTDIIPLLEANGYRLEGAMSGQMPSPKVMLSPRFGFSYDLKEDKSVQIRGGVGIFTSRLPLVWPSGSYVNNGLTIGDISIGNPRYSDGTEFYFIPDPYAQPDLESFVGEGEKPHGQLDLFSKTFRFPQIIRSTIAIDNKWPLNIGSTIEFIYSKTLNNLSYQNLNILPPTNYLTGQNGADTRPIYNWGRVASTYGDIMLGQNTNLGNAYNVTAQVQRLKDRGLSTSFAVTVGHAKALNDCKSYQNSWQWAFIENVNGRNFLDYSYSVFDLGTRMVGYLSYGLRVFGSSSLSMTLLYIGQSGRRFSYTYANGQLMTQETWSLGNDLIYIPSNESEINLVDIGTPGSYGYLSKHDQWLDLDNYIKNDEYLSGRRGQYAERNGARLPWENVLDFRLVLNLFDRAFGSKHTLQITLDVFNLLNLIDKDLGTRYYVSNVPYNLIEFVGFETNGTTPRFVFRRPRGGIYNIIDSGINSSRWQSQVGLRYSF